MIIEKICVFSIAGVYSLIPRIAEVINLWTWKTIEGELKVIDMNQNNNLNQKKNMYLIDMTGVNVTKELVSETQKTPLSDSFRFVEIEDHDVNYELINRVGLGVARPVEGESHKLIYNPNIQDSLDDEVMRFGIYYQLTHRDFDDKQLEKMLFDDMTGKVFMEIVFGEQADGLYNELRQLYDRKKGNIVHFRRVGE